MNDIKPKLQKKSNEWLVNQLVELANSDDSVADRIMLNFAAHGEDGSACIAKFKRQLDKAAEAIVDYSGPAAGPPRFQLLALTALLMPLQ